MSLNHQAFKGAKWTGLAAGAGALIMVVQISIVARYLQPEDFGAVAMIMVVLSIANVFVTTGFADVLIVKHEATSEQLSTVYWLNVLVGAIAYLVLFVGAPLLSFVIETDRIVMMGRVMGITLLIGAVAVQFNALMRRELLLKSLAIITLVANLFGCLVAVVLAVNGFGVWSLIFSAITVQSIITASLMTKAVQNNWLPSRKFNLNSVHEMMRFGSYRIGAALMNAFYTRVDQIAIGAVLGPAALGYYSVAFNLAIQPFSRINPVLTQVSFPVFSKIKDDDAKLLRGYRKGVRLITAINAPLLMGLIATAPLLVPVLLGNGWEPSIYVVQILGLFVLLKSSGNINLGLILAKEKYRWPLYWNVVLLIAFPLTIFTVARLGGTLNSISWSVVCLQFILFVMSYKLFAKKLLGDFTLGYLSDFCRPVLSGSAMAIAVYWFHSSFSMSSPVWELILSVGLGVVLYVVFSFFIQKGHFEELMALVKAKM
jgi:O-antigen/teichoic acid export membrane protein